jgi:hypothetical protein
VGIAYTRSDAVDTHAAMTRAVGQQEGANPHLL